VFADEELTNKHILEKITTMMSAAAFSLFDITYWNPNVALELGIAYGRRLDYYILLDPTKSDEEVLSDLRGIDRIQYASFKELETQLARLMRDQFGSPEKEQEPESENLVAQLDAMQDRIPNLLHAGCATTSPVKPRPRKKNEPRATTNSSGRPATSPSASELVFVSSRARAAARTSRTTQLASIP
jgi:hypothetical protein